MNWLRMSMIILIPALLNLTGGCDKKTTTSTNNTASPPPASSPKPSVISLKSRFTSPGTLIKRKAGEKVELVLPANSSTGYAWNLAEPLDGKILKLVGSAFKAPEDQMLGKGGESHWTFQTVGKGKTTIKMIYVRPNDKNTASARKVAFNISVE